MPFAHQPLKIEDLLSRGPLARLGRRVYVHDTVDSTNAFLLRECAAAGDGAVAWAESQTAGRGRLGRRWEAPRGSSILLSVLLIEPPDSSILSLSALLAAVAACEAIEAETHASPALRWPNDVVLQGRKLGGVLAESCPLPRIGALANAHPASRAVVVGVGINCLQQRGHFKGGLVEKATSLECELAEPIDRAPLAARLLTRLDYWVGHVKEQLGGCGDLRAAWRRRCEDTGTRVTLEHDGRRFSGTALDISDEGDLVVELEQGGRRCFASATTTRVG